MGLKYNAATSSEEFVITKTYRRSKHASKRVNQSANSDPGSQFEMSLEYCAEIKHN